MTNGLGQSAEERRKFEEQLNNLKKDKTDLVEKYQSLLYKLETHEACSELPRKVSHLAKELENDIQRLRSERESEIQRLELNEKESEIQSLIACLREKETTIASYGDKIRNLEDNVKNLMKENKNLKEENKKLRDKMAEMKDEMAEMKNKMAKMKDEISNLEDMIIADRQIPWIAFELSRLVKKHIKASPVGNSAVLRRSLYGDIGSLYKMKIRVMSAFRDNQEHLQAITKTFDELPLKLFEPWLSRFLVSESCPKLPYTNYEAAVKEIQDSTCSDGVKEDVFHAFELLQDLYAQLGEQFGGDSSTVRCDSFETTAKKRQKLQ